MKHPRFVTKYTTQDTRLNASLILSNPAMQEFFRRPFLEAPVWRSVLISLFVIHSLILAYYVLDIPVMDEWDMWYGWRGRDFWGWLMSRHNEHVILPTRLHIYLTATLVGAHPKFLALTSYGLFGLLLWSFFRLFRWSNPDSPTSLISAFLIFFLSTLIASNHMSGFHSQFHFVLVLAVLAIPLLFERELSPARAAIGTFFCLGMVLSFSTGIGQALTLSSSSALFRFLRRERDPKSFKGAVLMLVAVLIAVFVWLRGHEQIEYHPVPVGMFSRTFFEFLLNLIAYGFGVEIVGTFWGMGFLVVVFLPVIVMLRRGKLREHDWGLIVGGITILAAAATISVGRAPFGPEAAKSSRYGEITIGLIPISVCLWNRVFDTVSKIRVPFFNGLWLALFVTFLNNWTLHRYGDFRRDQLAGIDCLSENLRRNTYRDCRTLYPKSLESNLQRIESANAAFYENLKVHGN